jgi:hypothetical protein
MEDMRRKIEECRRDQERERQSDWRKLAVGLALGTVEIEPDEVLGQLNRFGKGLDDLTRVAERIAERSNLFEKAAAYEIRQQAAAKASKDFMAANQRIQAAREKLEADFRKVVARSTNADWDFRDSQAARRELLATCDPELKVEIAGIREQLATLANRRSELQEAIGRYSQSGDAHMETTASEELREIDAQAEPLRKRLNELEQQALRPEAVAV